jgi:Skp family chaperone for outer membrane proteins
VPAAAQDMTELGETLQRLEGMTMTQAGTLSKFAKKMDERTMGLESMLMQAAMNNSKVASANTETQERLEGMAMTAATEAAKFKRNVNEKFEELMTAMVEEMSGAGIGSFAAAAAPAPAAAPAAADGQVVVGDATGFSEGIQRLEGMAMQAAAGHAKFEKKVLERTEQLESMAMQAAMDRSKSHSQTGEVLNRLEQMTVQQATNVAKFEKKVESKNDSMESMLMQASMNHSKFEQLMDGRTSGMEAMLMAASVGSGKLTSMVAKLLPQMEEVELEASDLPTDSQYAGTGIGSDAAATTGEPSDFRADLPSLSAGSVVLRCTRTLLAARILNAAVRSFAYATRYRT